MRPFHGEVTRTTWLSPGLVRITLHDPELRDFPTTGIGDEYVRVHFPDETGTLHEPRVDDEGDWQYPGEYPHVQPYTIRRHDPIAAEIDLEFVVHGHGRAAAWAANAHSGDRLIFGAPRGLYAAPPGVTRCVFVTDATGIPALGRLLAQLDPGVQALAIVEIAEPGHRIELSSPARLEVQWIAGRGNGVAPSAMTEALRHVELNRDTYVWVAGEAGELRSARRFLRHERAHDPARFTVVGYWRYLHEEWSARWEALEESAQARLRGIWEETSDAELARDRYEDQLEKWGL